MQLTVKARPELAQALREAGGGAPAGAEAGDRSEADAIRTVLAEAGAAVEPLHPGEDDPELATWFLVSVPAAADAERVLATLRSSAAIEGAYAKPADELP